MKKRSSGIFPAFGNHYPPGPHGDPVDVRLPGKHDGGYPPCMNPERVGGRPPPESMKGEGDTPLPRDQCP